MRLDEKFHLRIPGPTPVPPRVQHAMNRPMIGHRSAECNRLVLDGSRRLREGVWNTGRYPDHHRQRHFRPGGRRLQCRSPRGRSGGGGDRRLRRSLCSNRRPLRSPGTPPGHSLGEACSPDRLSRFLADRPQVKAVFLTHCETSTGVLNPIRDLASVIRDRTDALIIVDGVSSLGGVPCAMDEWGIDILVTGSQKALMLPPGMAFVAVSSRAWEVIRQRRTPLLPGSSDLSGTAGERDHPLHPGHRPTVRSGRGPDPYRRRRAGKLFARHRLLMEMTRAGIRALGLPLLTEDAVASPTVTSVRGGDDLDVSALQQSCTGLA